MNIHDYLSIKKSSQGILFYMPTTNRLFLKIVFLYLHNLPKINNLPLEESLHIQIVSINQYIIHVYHLNPFYILPHIFIGASNSSNIGWLKKISLLLIHKERISFSVRFTAFPDLAPLLSKSFSIIFILFKCLLYQYRCPLFLI